MSQTETNLDKQIADAVRQRARDGELGCAGAFRIARDLDTTPRKVSRIVDELGVRLIRCQLGLFGYGDPKRIVEPAEEVPPELEQAIREGLILGSLPCAVAWVIAARFGVPKLQVSNAAEKLGVRIGQCQLGAFG